MIKTLRDMLWSGAEKQRKQFEVEMEKEIMKLMPDLESYHADMSVDGRGQ